MKQVKLIIALLTSDEDLRKKVIEKLEKIWGKVDYQGKNNLFDYTTYYKEELGKGLKRNIIGFEKLIFPYDISDIKLKSIEIEKKLSVNGNRKINIDSGYMDNNKVVLASTKGGGNKILISENIYVDWLLWYNKGWQPFPWAYPDFKDETYFEDFENMKKIYKKQILSTKF